MIYLGIIHKMNRHLLLVLLLIIRILPAWSQQESWIRFPERKTYGIITKDSLNNLIIAGKKYGGAGDGNYWVSKIDTSGNIFWNVINDAYPKFLDNQFSVVKTSNNNIFVAGSGTDHINNQIVIVAKFGSTGNLVWEKSFPFKRLIRIAELNVNKNGLLISGFVTDSIGALNMFLFKLNHWGDSIWCKNYKQISALKIISDSSGFKAIGNTPDKKLVFCKFDSQGNLLSSKTVSDSISPNSFLLLNESNFIISGVNRFESPKTNGYLLIIDSIGNLKFKRKFYFPGRLTGLFVNFDSPNKLYLTAGHDSVTVLSIDSTGNILNRTIFKSPYLSYDLNVTSTELIGDKLFICASHGNGQQDNEAVIIKFNRSSIGNVLITPIQNHKFRLVQNVHESQIEVHFSDQSLKSNTLKVYNLFGNLVTTTLIDSNPFIFNYKSLPIGIYIIVIESLNQIMHKEKLIFH